MTEAEAAIKLSVPRRRHLQLLMHPDVQRLTQLVAPPQNPVAVDLHAFERKVGVPLPQDFAQLMQTYGPGTFDEFVSVLAPDPAIRYTMFGRTQVEREINEGLAASHGDPDYSFPYPIYPDDGGLLKWGEHGGAHRLWWLTQGDPYGWPVLIQGSESEDFFSYDGTASRLICDLIEEKLDI